MCYRRFTFIDVGSEGRCSDGGVFSNTSLVRTIEDSSLKLPELQTLPNGDVALQFVFLADEAFPLKVSLRSSSCVIMILHIFILYVVF